jgi:predicted transcriptional regulator
MLRWLKSTLVGEKILGPLETELLRALWRRGDGTVRELLEIAEVRSAYTTVMTTLDRLYKKGVLDRSLDGRAFRYRPRQTEEEYNRGAVASQLQKLLASTGDAAAPISFLVDTVTEHDSALLVELQRAVGRKRRQLRKKEAR